MIKIKILKPTDKKNFSTRSTFPGAEGNPFDKVLRSLQKINQISIPLFFIFIIFLGGVFTLFVIKNWILLILFSLGDAFIIYLLPKFKTSFGPINSQVFLLFLLRSLFIGLLSPVNLVLQMIGTMLVIYGFIIEPSLINITTMELKTPQFSSQAKFLHLSDLHLEKVGIREEKLLRIIKVRNPDFILFTGDFLNLSNIHNQESIMKVIQFFNQLSAISPIFYVTGSPAVDVDETVEIIQKNLIAKRLHNSNISIRKDSYAINLIGITCTHQPHQDVKFLPPLIRKNHPNILLYHSPDLAYELKQEHKINLMLSGHTHGGQVCFPIIGAIFTGSLYGRTLQKGLYQIYDTLLFISRGIGLEGLGAPRVRFLCPPEIIEWKIND